MKYTQKAWILINRTQPRLHNSQLPIYPNKEVAEKQALIFGATVKSVTIEWEV